MVHRRSGTGFHLSTFDACSEASETTLPTGSSSSQQSPQPVSASASTVPVALNGQNNRREGNTVKDSVMADFYRLQIATGKSQSEHPDQNAGAVRSSPAKVASPVKKSTQTAAPAQHQIRQLIEDTEAYIELFTEKWSFSEAKVACFHQETDVFISKNSAARHGNYRLMLEAIAMINDRRQAGEPPILMARDAHNMFMHVEAVQREMNPASSMQTVRFVVKPDEIAFDHTVMCELDIHPHHILLAVVDSYFFGADGYCINEILIRVARYFPQLNIKMGVCLSGAQKGGGCLQYALAAAELVPSQSLAALKKKIADSNECCFITEDNCGQILPLEAYYFTQPLSQARQLLDNPALGQDHSRKILQDNVDNNQVRKFSGKQKKETVFINSIPTYKLNVLQRLLTYLEEARSNASEEQVVLAIDRVLVRPDQSWHARLGTFLQGLKWTPDEEFESLAAELSRVTKQIKRHDLQAGKAFFEAKALVFMEAFPFLQSQRLRGMPLKMLESLLDGKLSPEKRMSLVAQAVELYCKYVSNISKEEFDDLRHVIEDWKVRAPASKAGLLDEILRDISCAKTIAPDSYPLAGGAGL